MKRIAALNADFRIASQFRRCFLHRLFCEGCHATSYRQGVRLDIDKMIFIITADKNGVRCYLLSINIGNCHIIDE